MLARATENTESNLNATEGPESSEVGPSTKQDSVGSFDKKLDSKNSALDDVQEHERHTTESYKKNFQRLG